ncbi:MAG: right-handed parallel beta-helix repeat-containing protein [Sodaliphilus sp.]|nr:right-handed parallel beta-helix repeat-containing protein [Sodaliphilus sp.]
MKTKLFSLFAVAAMLLTTSCSNDEFNELVSGEPVTTSFKVQLPNTIGSRSQSGAKKAFADGKTATKLKYMVFDENGARVTAIPTGEKAISLTTDVQLTLITGKKYKIVFWAANANAPYTLDETGKVTVNYVGMKANDESLDAFCRCYEFTAGTEVENPVKLYRPFAQLNVGTADMAKAEQNGFAKAAAKTKVQVSGIANVLNVLTGAVSGDTQVTCDLAAIPSGETFPKAGYDYLSMDYLLVGKEAKSVVDVKWTVTDGTFNSERTFTNVPLQGNYRTNIFGNLLTSPTDFNVEIDPAFNEPDYEVPGTEVKDNNQLKKAVLEDGAVVKLAANQSFSLPSTVGDNVTIMGSTGSKIVIPTAVAWDGKTVKFQDVELAYGNVNYVGIQHAKAIKYENCKFTGKHFSYAEDAQYVGCTFTQDAVDYNIWTYGSKNIKFTNCTFNCKGKAALLYSESATLAQTATFDNCKFNASAPAKDKAAIEIDSSLGTNYDVYINNCVATGFAPGSVSGNSLWNQKFGNKTNLWVDGVQKLTRE